MTQIVATVATRGGTIHLHRNYKDGSAPGLLVTVHHASAQIQPNDWTPSERSAAEILLHIVDCPHCRPWARRATLHTWTICAEHQQQIARRLVLAQDLDPCQP